MANAGNPRNWEKAEKLLNDADSAARNNGLALLRLVQGDKAKDVQNVFLNTITADGESANRRSAALYLSQRKVSSDALPALSAAFFQERDQSVSLNILDAIARQPENSQAAVNTLKEVNQRCGSPETCSKAEALLLSLLSS